MKLIQRQLDLLSNFEVFRFQILAYIRIVSLSFPVWSHCEEIYNKKRRRSSTEEPAERRAERPLKAHNFSEPNLNPRYLLWAFRLGELLRYTSTFWMIYIITRYLFKDQLERAIAERIHRLDKPIHCYLVGRYIIHDSVNEVTAFIFSVAHLAWRSAQLFTEEYKLPVFDFWLLSKFEREMVYSKFDTPENSLTLAHDELERLGEHERALLDLMCYRMIDRSRVTFRLRPNRTRETAARVRLSAARITLVASWLYAIIAVTLTSIFTWMILSDSRYLKLYPNCDPLLEKLRREGRVTESWSSNMTPHRWFAGIGDGLENAIMWLEGGIVSFSAPCLATLFSQDILLHWEGIKNKLDQLHSLVELECCHKITPGVAKRSIIGRSAKFDDEICELMAEVADFFNQLKRADRIVTTFLNSCLVSSLATCASYTYYVRKQSIHQLPVGFTVTVAILVLAITFSCYGLLIIHRFCVGSYTKLCSLMAYDPMKHRHKYEPLLDFYIRKRSCFTVLSQFPFTPTTFLTMIGWTFSCFCIISSLLRGNAVRATTNGAAIKY